MADLTLKSQYERLLALSEAAQHQEALEVGRRILRVFPKFVRAYAALGQVHLEMGRQLEAAQLFRRVLSADPEHAGAYGCLGAIYEAQGLPDEAFWQLQRAVELDPAHQGYRQILKRVARSRGVAIDRLKMTRGGLARTYLRGQLYGRAVAELRDALADEPYRLDLQAALAEALWRLGQPLQAAEVCERLRVDLPYCLKANLILGQVWLGTERDAEARACLQRAQALDPDNDLAQVLLGETSPLPPRAARLPFTLEHTDARDLGEIFPADEGEEEPPPIIEGVARRPEPAFLAPRWVQPAPASTSPAWQPVQVGSAAHEKDEMARLSMARALRDRGMLPEALAQYAPLAGGAPEVLREAAHDLELLARLYPAHEKLLNLLEQMQANLASLGG